MGNDKSAARQFSGIGSRVAVCRAASPFSGSSPAVCYPILLREGCGGMRYRSWWLGRKEQNMAAPSAIPCFRVTLMATTDADQAG